jgi:uncharacterized membrane-anchored protein
MMPRAPRLAVEHREVPLRSSTWTSAFVVCLLAAGPAFAKHAGPKKGAAKPEAPAPEAEEPAAADEPPLTEAQKQFAKEFKSIEWTHGPAKVGIADHAEIQIPEGFAYTSSRGAQKLLELWQNPTNGNELGIVADKDLEITILFEFSDIGYVKDADKEKLDATSILNDIKEGNDNSNEARKERGWPPIRIIGWHTAPFYNKETNNLEWCISGESEGHPIINYNTRILGRQGVMSANLMVDPDKLNEALPVVKKLLTGYNFVEGKRYSQYVSGDKIAKYGLSALVVGGAVGIAAKTGILAKLGVFIAKAFKLVIVGILGLFAAIKKFLFGRKDPPPGPPQQPPLTTAGR